MVSRPRRCLAFTLIELLVVLAIVATLLAIVTPRYYHSLDTAKEAVLKENLATLRQVIDKYYGDRGKYPDNLDALVTRKYLRKIPVDPLTDSADTWVIVPPANAETGAVFDIHSGGAGTGSDGREYREW